MALRLYVQSYGSPGDVEKYQITSPGTIKEWGEAAKKAESETGSFVTCTTKAPPESTTTKEIAINCKLIESVHNIT